ncbi:LysM peptidoglycan-binding domain-containing protein [Histidinibacterium lentulum]|uniref:LysM domain-containing protein n=1 Tax=Histidinibacterium lentulum TaxID=2480588 RepID=A0A3N2R0R1_9RHOB|nr:LysM domain-containing protein [Histidinibacterium lentulum]ROU01067.1 LysM domain-containing protein [Histidinibacterium lentulum]
MTDQPALRPFSLMRTPAAPALLAMGVAALGFALLAHDRHEARITTYTAAATSAGAPLAGPDPAVAFAEAEAAGHLIRTATPVAPGAPAARPATYTAGPGEDLAGIAAKLYGNPDLAPRIAAANRAVLENGLRPGTTLLIPSF